MKIERLKENNKKKWIIGIIIFILLVSTITLVVSRAKYKVTQKIKLVEGTINFSRSDINVVALYTDGSEKTSVSGTNWHVDQTQSYCTTDGSGEKTNKDSSVIISFKNGKLDIQSTKKNTKCFIYLKTGRTVEDIKNSLELTKGVQLDFSIPVPVQQAHVATSNLPVGSGSGIYTALDDDGITYYYRGAVTNNYLKFAGFWWRIIRFNGDGSIRIIYDGTQYHANGTKTDNSIAIKNVQFNTLKGEAEYVGYMYTIGNRHGHSVSSNIKTQLDTWYTNNLKNYENYIDKNAGFCGDRSIVTSGPDDTMIKGQGTGSSRTYYGEYNRKKYNTPRFDCPEATYDLYTTSSSTKGNKALTNPIGLITADEVIFAGGNDRYYLRVNDGYDEMPNTDFYLYNGYSYWTMTPFNVPGYSWGPFAPLAVSIHGSLPGEVYKGDSNTRPVINLKSNVVLSGNGTQSSPYQVVELA